MVDLKSTCYWRGASASSGTFRDIPRKQLFEDISLPSPLFRCGLVCSIRMARSILQSARGMHARISMDASIGLTPVLLDSPTTQDKKSCKELWFNRAFRIFGQRRAENIHCGSRLHSSRPDTPCPHRSPKLWLASASRKFLLGTPHRLPTRSNLCRRLEPPSTHRRSHFRLVGLC